MKTPQDARSQRDTKTALGHLKEPAQVFAADGVDDTVIQWMLARTPTERLQAAQDLLDTAWALRRRED